VGIFECINPVKGLKLWKPQVCILQITLQLVGFNTLITFKYSTADRRLLVGEALTVDYTYCLL
jgi:hypothetical protein